MAYKIMIMGASYGSLLASKILFGGHSVHLICLPAEADLINSEGFRVRLPVKGRKDHVEIDSRKLPGKVTAGGTTSVNPADFDLIGLAVLPDGRILAPNGVNGWLINLNRRNRIFRVASMRRYHGGGLMVPMPDGGPLVVGGSDCTSPTSCAPTRLVERYNPPADRPVVSRLSVTGFGRVRAFAYRLNEAATVRLIVEMRARGRWRRLLTGPRKSAHAGRNRTILILRRLAAGRYRVRVVSRDPFDEAGDPKTATFRLI